MGMAATSWKTAEKGMQQRITGIGFWNFLNDCALARLRSDGFTWTFVLASNSVPSQGVPTQLGVPTRGCVFLLDNTGQAPFAAWQHAVDKGTSYTDMQGLCAVW